MNNEEIRALSHLSTSFLLSTFKFLLVIHLLQYPYIVKFHNIYIFFHIIIV